MMTTVDGFPIQVSDTGPDKGSVVVLLGAAQRAPAAYDAVCDRLHTASLRTIVVGPDPRLTPKSVVGILDVLDINWGVLVGDREVQATGDRDLIFDAIANLVDNALKHGRHGGEVVVACENIDGQALVSISDDGPGIPPCEHEHVFKRFYRLEQSRYTPGNGLGLSLVAAVARLHGARIELLPNTPGLKVKLWFAPPTG